MGDSESDWAAFIAAVTDHQIQTERTTAFLRDETAMEESFTKLRLFHHALHDNATPQHLAAIAESIQDPLFPSIGLNELAELRTTLSSGAVRTTPVEMPGTAHALCQTYARLSRVTFDAATKPSFLLATDSHYRPHASVQEWSSNTYLLLMGRYVWSDMGMLAMIIAQLVTEAAKQLPEVRDPWNHPDFQQILVSAVGRNSTLCRQIPYALAAALCGERYRVALPLSGDPKDNAMLAHLTAEIQQGAFDFMIGHEIGHVTNEHTRAERRPVSEFRQFPWYAKGTFGRVKPASLVEDYLRDYWPAHSLELEADLSGVITVAEACGPNVRNLRLMGTQLAISMISILDRGKYLVDFGQDPVEIMGSEMYGLPAIPDLSLPMPTHPWGKTRATALSSTVKMSYGQWFNAADSDVTLKAMLMSTVGQLLGTFGGQVIHILRWITRRSGEYMVSLLPGDLLITNYWEPHFRVGHDEPTEIRSTQSKFYADVASDLGTMRWAQDDYGWKSI